MKKYFADISSSLENLSSFREDLAEINQMFQGDLPSEAVEIVALEFCYVS